MRPPLAFHDFQHQPVDMIGHAGDHVARRLAHPLRPVPAHQFVVCPDAARSDDDRLRLQRKISDDLRELFTPRSTLLGSSMSPCTPSTAPPVLVSAVTRWRKRNETSPLFSASRTRRTNGSISPVRCPR